MTTEGPPPLPPASSLEVTSESAGPATVVVRPRGDIDTATVGQLRGELADRLAAGARHVVLDMSGVQFLGSSGLALLVEHREAAMTRRGGLCLVGAPRAVTRPLKITGLLEHFDVAPDVATALAHVAVTRTDRTHQDGAHG